MMDLQDLIQAAIDVRQRAYAPYSKFQVGAALQLDNWPAPLLGCNVENASYGLGICAERMAIGAAVAAADPELHPWRRIVVAASPLATPCGACRQCLAEFASNLEVICVDPRQPTDRQHYRISDLLPHGFSLNTDAEG